MPLVEQSSVEPRERARNGHTCNWTTAVALLRGVALVLFELGQPCQAIWMISTNRRYSTIRYVIIPAPPSPKVWEFHGGIRSFPHEWVAVPRGDLQSGHLKERCECFGRQSRDLLVYLLALSDCIHL